MVMVFDFIQTACVIVVLSNVLSRRGFFSELRNADKLPFVKTVVCVLLFVFLSLYGILIRNRIVSGVYVDTRIVGIILSGMLFGAPISYFVFVPTAVISIIIGGSTLWADMIAMVMACVISSICHKKFPNTDAALTGIITGLLEIVHMLLLPVFVRPIETAKEIMYSISFPMIVVNGCAAILFMLVISDNVERRRLLEEESAAKSEYNIANEIQSSLLNKNFNIDERLDLCAYLKPAYEVGGDLYGYTLEDKRFFKFIIGDVSGKGISAALTMSRCVAFFEDTVPGKNDPSEILSILNKRLAQNNQAQMFVTAMLGILDLSNGELIYSNAGHVAPYLVTAASPALELERPLGKPLGIIAGEKYENKSIVLNKGQYLVSYTDGVTDAVNKQQERFDKSRLVEALSGLNFSGAEEIKTNLIETINVYSAEAKQADDIAVICFGLSNKDNEG